jgi:hypothetical protein
MIGLQDSNGAHPIAGLSGSHHDLRPLIEHRLDCERRERERWVWLDDFYGFIEELAQKRDVEPPISRSELLRWLTDRTKVSCRRTRRGAPLQIELTSLIRHWHSRRSERTRNFELPTVTEIFGRIG